MINISVYAQCGAFNADLLLSPSTPIPHCEQTPLKLQLSLNKSVTSLAEPFTLYYTDPVLGAQTISGIVSSDFDATLKIYEFSVPGYAGNYILTGFESSDPCAVSISGVNTVTVTILPSTTIVFTPPAPYTSIGVPVNISALATNTDDPTGASSTYTWVDLTPSVLTPPLTNNNVNFTSGSAGAFNVTCVATDINLCKTSDQITVNVYALDATLTASNISECAGTTVTLNGNPIDGSGSYTNFWDVTPFGTVTPTGVGTTAEFTTATPGTYNITYQVIDNVTGASASDNIDITVNAIPASKTIVRVNRCIPVDGSVTVINSDIGVDYSLYESGLGFLGTEPGNGVDITWVLGVGDYSVIATNAVGCTRSFPGPYTIGAYIPPTVSPTAVDPTICEGSSTELNANAVAAPGSSISSYTWDNATILSVPNTVANPTAYPIALGTTTYSVTVVDDKGCSDSEGVDVEVTPAPIVTINSTDNPICVGETTTLSAASDKTVASWYWDSNVPTATATIGDYSITPLITTNYDLTVTDIDGCSTTETYTVTVNSKPTANAGLDQTMCLGAGTILSGSATGGTGAGTYIFSWSGGAIVSPTDVTVNPSPAGVYPFTLTVTDTNNCTDDDQVNVTVVTNPTVDAGANQSSCSGEMVNLAALPLSGLAPYTYSWEGGAFIAATNYDVSPTNPIAGSAPILVNYNVIIKDANSCTGTDNVSVTVNAPANVTIINDGAKYCTDAGIITMNATPAGGTWTEISGTIPMPGNTFDPMLYLPGFYTFEYEYTDPVAGGCTTSEQATIQILPYATPNPTDIDIENEPLYCNTDIGPYLVQGVMVPDLTAQPGVVESYSGNGITDNLDGTASFDPTVAGAGVHTITYTVTTPGCSNSFTEDVTIGTEVNYIGLPAFMCMGDPDFVLAADNVNGEWSIRFIDDATSTTHLLGPYTYGDPGAVLQAAEPGIYYISYQLTNPGEYNCSPEASVRIYDIPTVSFTIDGKDHDELDINFCDNSTFVSLSGTADGITSAIGVFTGAGVTLNQFNPATGAGTYYVTYTHTDANGCSNSVTSEAITVNAAPIVTIDGLNITNSYCKSDIEFTITGNPTTGSGGIPGTFNFPATWNNGDEYTWPTAVDGEAQIDPSIVDPTGSYSINYQVTDLNGCIGTITEIIDINPLPTLDINGIPAPGICKNDTPVTLTGSPTDVNGSFTGDGITDNGNGTATFDPGSLAVGTYAITYTYTDVVTGCTNNITKNINVIEIPIQYSITAPGGDEYCEGAAGVQLAVSNAQNTFEYDLVRNGTTVVITYTALADGTFTFPGTYLDGIYTVVARNPVSGCTVNFNNSVTITEIPAIDDAGAISGNTDICPDGITVYTYSVPAITNATDYVWNLPAGVTLSVDGGNTIGVIFDITYVTGVIEVYGIDPANTVCPVGASSTKTVNKRNIPVALGAAISGDNVVCTGETGKIYSIDPANFDFETSFEWQTTAGTITSDPTAANVTVSFPVGSTTGILSVRGVNACGTSAWVTFAITTNPIPNVTISPLGAGDLIDCDPASQVQLTANTTEVGASWLWTASNGGIILVGDENVQNPRVTHEGDFTVQIEVTTSGQACYNTATISVGADKTAPVISIDPHDILTCDNTSIFLQGNSNATNSDYNWTYTPPSNVVGSTNTDNPEVDAPGTYTLTVTDLDNSCISTISTIVTENILAPNISVTDPATNTITCVVPAVQVAGNSTTLNATYEWTTAIVGATISTPTNNTTNVDRGGVYLLTVTDPANGCISSLPVTVNEDIALPVITSLLNNDVPGELSCNNSSVELEAQAAADPNATFAWSTITGTIVSTSGTNNQLAEASAIGDYYVVATDPVNGCQSLIAAITVTEDFTTPNISIISPLSELDCNNTTTTIDASATTDADVWTWTYSAGGNIVAGQGTNTITVDAPATYTLIAENTTTGCTSVGNYIITEDIIVPAVSINAGIYEIACDNLIETINATGDTDPLTTYLWTGPVGGIVGPDDILNISVDLPGVYTITATSVNGCTNTDVVTVVDNTAIPDITLAPVLDLTCTQTSVQISGSSIVADTYLWNVQSGSGTILNPNVSTTTVDGPGTFRLTVTNSSNGCSAFGDVVVSEVLTTPALMVTSPAANQLTCDVTSVQLEADAVAGTTFSWTTGVVGAIISDPSVANPYVNKTGNYTVVAQHPTTGCTQSAVVTVNSNYLKPTVNIVPDAWTITCTQSTINLNASSSTDATSFVWSTGDGNIVIGGTTSIATISEAGTYDLIVTNGVTGCTETGQVIITDNLTAPNVNIIGGPYSITCTDPTPELLATVDAGSTVLWSGPGTITNATTLNPTVDADGTYTITATAANGCIATDNVLVSLDNNSPNITVDTNADDITCTRATVDVSGSSTTAGVTFLWNVLSGGGTVTNPANPTATVNADGDYQLTVTAPNGCINSDIVTVGENTITPNVNLPLVDDEQITCNQTIVTLNASSTTPGVMYSWSTLIIGATISNGNSPTPDVDKTGDYTVTVTDPVNGCTSSATTTVTGDFTVPAVSIAAASQITCSNPTVTLNASSVDGINYTWVATLGGHILSNYNTATPTVDAAGRYTVTVEHITTGCTTTGFVDVNQDNSVPVIDVFNSFPGEITCTNPTVTLLADATALTTNKNILWTTSDGHFTTATNISNPAVDEAGTYVVTITNTDNDCSTVRSVTIDENTTPPAISIDVPLELTCSRTQVNLNATGTSVDSSPVTYLWSAGAGGSIVSGASTATAVVNAVANYTVTVTDLGNGCTNSSTVFVDEDKVLPDVSVNTSPDYITCDNATVILNGVSIYPNVSYQWTTTGSGTILNSTTQTPVVNAAGTYNLTVTNLDNNCSATSVNVIVTEDKVIPVVSVNAPSGDLTCSVNEVTISVSNNIDYSYSWSGPGTIITPNSYSTNVDAAGTYTVVVEDIENGCTNMFTVDVDEDLTPVTSPIISNIETCYGTSNPGFTVTSGTNVRWYNDAGLITYLTTGNSYTPVVTSAGTHSFYATSTGANGCESLPREVTLTIHELPVVPVAIGNTICEGDAPEMLTGIGTNIKWYDNTNAFIVASTTYAPTDVLNGTYTYYATQTDANGCESATASAQYVINSIPVPPIFIDPDIEVCQTLTNPSFTVVGSDIKWYKNIIGTAIATGNTHQPDEIIPGTYNYYATQAVNGCESNDATGTFTINPMPVKYNVTGGGSYCEGGLGVLVGLADSETGVNYELWLDESILMADLPGTGAALDFGNQTDEGNYTVYGYNTTTLCKFKMNGGVSIVIKPLPGDATSIVGSTTVCQNETGVNYTVDPISDATDYVWSVPVGFTIVSGDNSNSITVNIDNTAVDGDITVYAQNSCGAGNVSPVFFVTVNPIPGPALNLTGPAIICNDEDGVLFSVDAVSGATYYNWTLPQGATVVAGANSRQITLNFDYTAVDDEIRVAAANGCGEGTSISQMISVTDLPYVSAGDQQDLCDDNTILDGNTPSVGTGTWSIFNGAATISNINDPTATVTNIGEGQNTLVWSIVASGCSLSDTLVITNNKVFVEAGNNQAICSESITLQGNAVPVDAVGSWSVTTGTANFSSGNIPNAVASGFATGINILKWTISKNGCTNFDTVIVDNQRPTQAYAGIDQSICRDTTQLGANTPVVGTGLWTVAVGAATFDDASNPNTIVRNLSKGDNVLRWTISNGICTTSDDVKISNNKVNVFSGVDQVICDRTTTMDATAPSSGTGYWAVVSGSAAFVNLNLYNTIVTGLSKGLNILSWNINNNGCISSDTVFITNDSPTEANAGLDQIITANLTTLQGNTPVIGTGVWNLISGSSIIDNINDPNTNVSSLGIGENTFRWTITNNSCISTDDVVITNFMSSETNAGLDQTICGSETTLSGNQPAFGFGEWSVIQGTALFTNINDPNTKASGLATGDNILRWSVWENGWTYDDVIISNDSPSEANAGTDKVLCSDSTFLAGNEPIIGKGKWTVISGSGIFENDTIYNTKVRSLAKGENIFKWTITNKSCSSTDFVKITNDLPTLANAGIDEISCENSVDLYPNTPSVGVGEWRVLSGSANFVGNTAINLATGPNILRWTIVNNSCSSYDDVTITNNEPSDANAGANKVICYDSIFLAANMPVVGTGVWTIQSGSATIADLNNPTSKVTNLSQGINVFRWTITYNGCTKFDEVTINNALIEATAGIDQTICSETTVLEANNSGVGNGTWSVLGGSGSAVFSDINQPDTRVNGLHTGANVLRWTITNEICVSYDDVIITNSLPTTAFAGPDQAICLNNTSLQANTPIVGVGEWSILSGSASITDLNDAASTINNLEYGVNTLRWTITNGSCISSDEVVISNNSTITSNAGIDQTLCTDSSFLYANIPTNGTGYWSVVSGSATFVNNNSYNTKVINIGKGENILRWVISNGECSSADVVSVVNNSPTKAVAGGDQAICGNSTYLQANIPVVGTGAWSLVSGAATFANSSQNNTQVTGLNPGSNTLRWTIENNGCTSYDNVVIYNDLPYLANAGDDFGVCGNSTSLYANDPVIGVGKWTVVSGSAAFDDDSRYDAIVSDLGFGANTLRWTITYDHCTTYDEIIVTNNKTEVYAGIDQTVNVSNTLLAANNPSTGIGEWTVIGGSGVFEEPNNSVTNVSNLGSGLNTFRWSLLINGCVSSDDVSIIYNVPPEVNFVISSSAGCPPLTVYYINNSLNNLDFIWEFGDGNTSTDVTVQHVYNEPGDYQATLKIFGANGEIVSRDTTITVYEQPKASFIVVNHEVYIPEEDAIFINTSEDAVKYNWNFGDSTTSTLKDPKHEYTSEGEYDVFLEAWSENNCYDYHLVEKGVEVYDIGVISFPNAFTPNTNGPSGGVYNPSDYSNDVFYPIGEGINEYHLEIFNKWGVFLFESNDILIGWDGYYDNKLLNEGVYVWKVTGKLNNGRAFKKVGTVLLIRK